VSGEYFIIGSGPTGVAAASALLKRRLKVTMLDAGLSLEESKQLALNRTTSTSQAEWKADDLEDFKAGTEATAKGITLKMAYGSDFPYRGGEQFIAANGNIGIVPSLAQGGLSNVWGAAMLPYAAEDITDWPISVGDLEPHYRAVLEFTGLAGESDDLTSKFPLYTRPHNGLRSGSIINSLLEDMRSSREQLSQRHVIFGRSRLAVSEWNQHKLACASCRMCMYGCPLGLIYNSGDTLKLLRNDPNFTYRRNIIVKTFREQGDGIEIDAHDVRTKNDIVFHAARLLIAAGTLSTTRLVLESLYDTNAGVQFKDSQYFLLPFLRYRAAAGFDENEPEHTLAQAFIEIFDDEVSTKSVHLQVYGYNSLYRGAIKSAIGPLYHLGKPFIDSFLKRFILLQGYLHSDYSHQIEARLLPREKNALTARLSLKVKQNPATNGAIGRLTRKLRSVRPFMRGLPLSALRKISAPGRGFHTGGSFPMRSSPGEFETGVLGTPGSCRRVHIVDSSVFSSIPASTITLTAMANAHRIATEIPA
jgi:choline dehydrogenase-like flavoprotein